MHKKRWQDSKLLNWRLGPTCCIRILPGLWIPGYYHNRENECIALMLPFLTIALDYKDIRNAG